MLKFLKDKKKDNKGFTLVELVIVVAILAILVGILAPQYTKYVEKSRKAADASNLENLVTVVASDSTDTIAAGEYIITLSNDANVSVTQGTTTSPALDNVFNEFAGNDWAETRLKSKKWKNDDNGNTISAKVEVGADGSVTVTYNPTSLKTTANE